MAQARATQLKANARETALRLRKAMERGQSAGTREEEFVSSLPYVFDISAQARGCTVGQSDVCFCASKFIGPFDGRPLTFSFKKTMLSQLGLIFFAHVTVETLPPRSV